MHKNYIFLSILLCLFLNFSLWAQNEKIEDFVVSVYDRSIKVVSPDSIKTKFSVVVENKSLGKIVGKIQGSQGKVMAIMSIEPSAFSKIEVESKKGERYFFIPMAPAFQEAELIVGHQTYEIPPRN